MIFGCGVAAGATGAGLEVPGRVGLMPGRRRTGSGERLGMSPKVGQLIRDVVDLC